MTIATSYEQVTYNGPDGAQVGKSATEKIGFYGKTPIVQPSVTWPDTATATTTLNETKCQRLMTALVNLGLIVTT
jgi:hypothetical protein